MMSRRQHVINWAAIVASLTAFVGGSIKLYYDSKGHDRMETVVAEHIGAANQKWAHDEELRANVAKLAESISVIRESLASLKTSMSMLIEGRDWMAKKTASEAPVPEPVPIMKKNLGKPVDVQQVKKDLFEDPSPVAQVR